MSFDSSQYYGQIRKFKLQNKSVQDLDRLCYASKKIGYCRQQLEEFINFTNVKAVRLNTVWYEEIKRVLPDGRLPEDLTFRGVRLLRPL